MSKKYISIDAIKASLFSSLPNILHCYKSQVDSLQRQIQNLKHEKQQMQSKVLQLQKIIQEKDHIIPRLEEKRESEFAEVGVKVEFQFTEAKVKAEETIEILKKCEGMKQSIKEEEKKGNFSYAFFSKDPYSGVIYEKGNTKAIENIMKKHEHKLRMLLIYDQTLF